MALISAKLRPSRIAQGSGFYKTISRIDNYSHVISAFIGYDTAQVGFIIRRDEADKFMTHALGSEFRSYSHETGTIFHGFVNEIVMTYDGEDIIIGPFIDIANSVLVRYTEYSTGLASATPYANSVVSQLRYGTLVKILSSSQISDALADNIRDNYLEENRHPAYNVSLTTQPPEINMLITLNCLGNGHLLGTHIYNNAINMTYTVREKLIEVLGSYPGGLFASTGLIAFNSLAVPRLETEDRLATDIIKELVSIGSQTNSQRMTFGVYDDFIPIYQEVSPTVKYAFGRRKNNRFIVNEAGGLVNPASLRPGQYVAVSNLPRSRPSGTGSVPAFIFAESVQYTAPFGLTVTGSKVSTLEQKLAKLGLSGL